MSLKTVIPVFEKVIPVTKNKAIPVTENKWYSTGYPVWRLAWQGQCWDWLARCQCTVTGWDCLMCKTSLSAWQRVFPLCLRPPRWPSGKASASRAEDPGFESRLRRDFFGVESYQWLPYQSALQWLPYQAPGVIGSALGLVGPVSVYSDWVR